jgi:ABC-type glycerol-3-phosphate transport system substrate-binding protein
MLGAGALAAGMAAGCSTGGGGTNAGTEPKLVAPSGTAAPEIELDASKADLTGGPQWTAPDLGGVTMTLWGLNYAPHVERYKLLIKRFEEATGAKVTLQPQDDVGKQMLTSLSGGNPPDAVCLMGKMSDQLVNQGGLLDLTDAVYGDLKIDMEKWWMPDAIGAYTWGDKQFGVPLEGNAHAGVGSRLDLIDAAGSEAADLFPGSHKEEDWPAKGVHFESFDQMFELAKLLQKKSGDKVQVWGQNRQGWEVQQLASVMWQQDTLWWDEQSGQFNLDNDATITALEWMVTKPYKLGIESRLAAGNSVNAYVAGQTALAIGNDSAAGEGTKAGFKGTNVVHPSVVPGEEPRFIGEGGWGIEVPLKAKNQAAGIEFARFITTYDAQFTFSQIYGGMSPACRALVGTEIYQGDSPLKQGQRRLLVAGANTQYQGNGFDPQIETMLNTTIGSLREGKITSREAAAQMQKQATEQQQRYART